MTDGVGGSRREFDRWVKANAAFLQSSGLPLVAWETQRNWGYFIEHASVPYEADGRGFRVSELTDEEASRLLRFLDDDGAELAVSHLAVVLRERCGPLWT